MNNKHLTILVGIAFALLANLIACSKAEKEIEQEVDTVHGTLAYYAKDWTSTQEGPLYMTEINGAVMSLYTSPKMPECEIMYYQAPQNHEQWMMMISNDNIFFIPMDASGTTVEIYAFGKEEGFSTLLTGAYNTRTGVFNPTGAYPTGVEIAQTKAEYDDFDWVRRSLKSGVIDPLFTYAAKLCSVIPHVGTIMGDAYKTAEVVSLMHLMDGAGTVLGDEIKQTLVINSSAYALGKMYDETSSKDSYADKTVKLLIDMMPFAAQEMVSRQVYRFSEYTRTGEFPSDEEDISQGVYSLNTRILNQSNKYYSGVTNVSILPEPDNPFILSIHVSDIGERTATFSGSSSAGSGYGHASDVMVEQGFKYIREKDGHENYVKSDGLEAKSVTLYPASAYMAMAYIKTMSGKEWHSTAVRFVTKGTLLEFEPLNSFSFSSEGGELATNVIVGDEAKWEVKSAPAWCTVRYSSTDMRVSAQKGSIERAGEIIVETTSPYGEKESASLPVIQKSLSWDGTVWSMHYSFHLDKATGDEHFSWEDDIPGPISSTFIVGNAAAGEYADTGIMFGSMRKVSDTVLSFHNSNLEEYETQIINDKNEIETVKVTVKREVSVTFTRTDLSHVKVSGTLTASASGAAEGSAKVSISGSGNLIGATKGTVKQETVPAHEVLSFPRFSPR